jgi:PKD repeat protein
MGFTSSVFAQLSGTYTLNSGSTTVGTNFANWTDFAAAINTNGVSGPVVLNVLTDQTRTAPVVFNNIATTSATNTVTINGGGRLVSYPGTTAAPAVFDINGADYFTFNNLVVRNTATITQVRGFWLRNVSNYNTISNCRIEFSALATSTTSTISGGAYIAFTASATSLTTTGNNGSYNKVIGNTCRTTNTSSPGPFAGIFLYSNALSTSSSTQLDNEITNNKIENFFFYGIYVYNHDGVRVVNNDITRINAGTATSLCYGVYFWYNKSSSRPLMLNNNNIHDFSATSTVYGIQAYYNNYYGTNSGDFQTRKNIVRNLTTTGSSMYSIMSYYTNGFLCDSNRIENPIIQSSFGSYWGIALGFSGGSENITVSNNDIQGPNNSATGTWNGIWIGYPQSGTNTIIEKNNIHDFYKTGGVTGSIFGIYHVGFVNNSLYRSRPIIRANRIDKINNLEGSNGQVWGIYSVNANIGVEIYSNLITGIKGFQSAGIYAVTTSTSTGVISLVEQNTIVLDGTGITATNPLGIGFWADLSANVVRVRGNIFQIDNYSGAALHLYNTTTSPLNIDMENNTYWTNTGISTFAPRYLNTQYASVPAFISATGIKDRWANPTFINPSAGNFATTTFAHQNKMATNANNTIDVMNRVRNPSFSDIGALETTLDLAATTTTVLPVSICSGDEIAVSVTITNNYIDTATNFPVRVIASGGNTITENFMGKIAPGQSGTHNFIQKAKFNSTGVQTLTIGLGFTDDLPSNDATILTTSSVKPSPGGTVISASTKATNTIYNLNKPSVTQINTHAYWDLTAPRGKTNADYGTTWRASSFATTASGVMLPMAATTITGASSSGGLEVDFMTTDANLEDSIINVFVKFSDLLNSCDTTIRTQILIHPTAVPDFDFPSQICFGSEVLFNNTSTIKTGVLGYEWNFGTSSPSDITSAPNPVFVFPAEGTFVVTLTTYTLPYNFPKSVQKTVTVSPIPKVTLAVTNACQGTALNFVATINPSNAVLSWKMGDGSTKANLTNVTHTYANTGRYIVSLKAELNGCVETITRNAYQFDKPKALATLTSGSCENDFFELKNNSTIASGTFGSKWDMDDNGNIATTLNQKYKFSSSGQKNVRLTVISAFGCTDQVTIPVTVRESPKVSFINTAACSIDPTEFTNTTPATTAGVKTYSWIFGDGGTSMQENPSHVWARLGEKQVKFKIELLNGCIAEISKDVKVGIQPQANFSVANVCAGEPSVFDNSTTWPSGEISYTWDFADGNTSNNSDPIHTYTTAISKTYVVTLTAKITDGCEDVVTKQITISEKPQTCDFELKHNYTKGIRVVNLNPLGGNAAGISYRWLVSGYGSYTSVGEGVEADFTNTSVKVKQITMVATTSAGCECRITKTIALSNTGTQVLNTMSLFPNPAHSEVTLTLAQAGESQVQIFNAAGALVKTLKILDKEVKLDVSTYSAGLYTIKAVQNGQTFINKLIVQ